MTKKYNLENLKAFAYNPFVNYKSAKILDEPFIDSLSKTAKSLIKYLIYKGVFAEEKFLFHVKAFNRFMKYINMDHPADGLAELCSKDILAKRKDPDLYWVNKDLLNTGVLEPIHIACTEQDSYK